MANDVRRLVARRTRALDAYTVATPPHRIKLNQNESTVELPEIVKETALSLLRRADWARYPVAEADGLTETLREQLALPAEAGILVGNGSNELIQALLMALVEPGTRIVTPVPTFSIYRMIASILGAEVVEVPLDPTDLSFDRDAILDEARRTGAKAIVLCRPNNPTGTTMSLLDLDRLAAEADGLVIVDEAYHDFADDDAVGLLGAHRNLVILRTFSKAFRAAGIRIGCLLGDRSLCGEIDKALLPFNVGHATRAVAAAILQHRPRLQPGIDAVIDARERLTTEMAAIPGVEPIPSQANFVCFRTVEPAGAVFDALLGEGILVRDVSRAPLLQDALRVTVGTDDENRAFLDALRRTMKEARGR